MKETMQLLDQLIEYAQVEDLKHKKESVVKGKGSQAIGEGFMLFHLKHLKNLLEKSK